MMKFYRAKLSPCESGLVVHFDIYKSIHETEHYYFCVNAFQFKSIKAAIDANKELSVTQLTRKRGVKVRRIAKVGSRIAQRTPELAADNLRYRTEKRIEHMKRDIVLCRAFLDNKEPLITTFESEDQLTKAVYDTQGLVSNYFIFN